MDEKLDHASLYMYFINRILVLSNSEIIFLKKAVFFAHVYYQTFSLNSLILDLVNFVPRHKIVTEQNIVLIFEEYNNFLYTFIELLVTQLIKQIKELKIYWVNQFTSIFKISITKFFQY